MSKRCNYGDKQVIGEVRSLPDLRRHRYVVPVSLIKQHKGDRIFIIKNRTNIFSRTKWDIENDLNEALKGLTLRPRQGPNPIISFLKKKN